MINFTWEVVISKAKKLARKKSRINKKAVKDWFNDKHPIKPKSEIWFDEKLKEHDVKMPLEENYIFAGYIPDYINKHYKVIIEVDGSFHDQEHIKKKDAKKDKRFNQYGYTVIRVIAYDDDSLQDCVDKLIKIRLSKPLK